MREEFFKAVRLLEAGKPEAALEVIEGLLRRRPDNPDVLQLAGVARVESGDAEGGRELLSRAEAQSPENPEIHYNHGSALMKIGRFDDALARFDRCLELAPGHPGAWHNRGAALEQLGRIPEARESYHEALRLAPNHVGALYNLGNLEVEARRFREAEGWYQRALAARADHAGAWLGLGRARLLAGRPGPAITALEHAVQIRPDDARAWSELGRAHSLALNFDRSFEAHKRAMELAPDDPDHWNNLGAAHTNIGELEPAETAFRRALELAPDHEDALSNYAELLELANRPEEAMEWVRRAERPSSRLALVEARCARREGDLDRARGLLEPLCDDEDHEIARRANFTLGQVLDQLDEPAAAFGCFAAGNRHSGAQWRAAHQAPDQFLPALEKLHHVFADGAPWAAREGAAEGPSPIFLFGFQRSGTTLLDTVMGGHDRVQVMEELPVLKRVIQSMVRNTGPYPERLPRLGNEDLIALRQRYLELAGELAGYDPDGGRILLDKSPLHTVHAGFIRMLFPESPLILALRHPLDVCLSCFMQDFSMNAFMTHFLTVEGVAEVYAGVMDLWLLYERVLELPHHRFRYEALVESPETELRRAVEYCGLEWDDGLMNYREHARSRGLINTPSYEQVTRPIYRSASGRWRRYRRELASVEPKLEPYVRAFGY